MYSRLATRWALVSFVLPAAAGFVSACSGSRGPTIGPTIPVGISPSTQIPITSPDNPSPSVVLPAAPVARVVAQIDQSGSAIAIAGYTPVLLDASASEGDHLHYTFAFGDGESTNTANASITHVYRTPGLFYSKVTVRDSVGRDAYEYATVWADSLLDRGPNSALSFWWVTGFSRNRIPARQLTFVSQDGSSLRGYYTHPELNRSDFTAALSGERALVIKLNDGTITFTGEVQFSDGVSKLSLLMRGGSTDGQTLTFSRYYLYP